MNFNIALLLIIGGLMFCIFFGQILLLARELLTDQPKEAENLDFAERYVYIHDEVTCFDRKRELKEKLLDECRTLIKRRKESMAKTKTKLIAIDSFVKKER